MNKPQDWTPDAGDPALLRVEVVRSFDGSDGIHVMAYYGDQQIDAKLADLLPVPDPAAPTAEDVLEAAALYLRELQWPKTPTPFGEWKRSILARACQLAAEREGTDGPVL